MTIKNQDLKLPRLVVAKLSLPMIALVLGVILLFVGRNNIYAGVLGVFALGLSIKGFWDMTTKKTKLKNIYNKAVESIEKGQIENALMEFKEGLELDKDNPYLNMGLVLLNQQEENYEDVLRYIDRLDLDEIRELKEFRELEFDDRKFKSIKGEALFKTGRYEEALEVLEAGEDEDNQFRLLTALSYRELGRLEESVDILTRGPVVENRESLLAFDYWLGVVLYELGKKDQAKESFDRVYKEDENYEKIEDYIDKYG